MSENPPFWRDMRLLVWLFVGFRVLALLVYQPQLNPDNGAELRGLAAYGDYGYHFEIANGLANGILPYRDYWYEYPPLIALISHLAFIFGRGSFNGYATALPLILIAFDTLNLLLVRRIGVHLYGEDHGAGLAWLYALMIAPFVLLFWNFEAVVTCCILVAIALLIEQRLRFVGVVIGLGALVKVLPVVILAAAIYALPPRKWLPVVAIAAMIAGIGFGGILIIGAEKGFGTPSVLAQFSKASHQTVWALIDQNYRTGLFSPDRFNAQAALTPIGNPPVVPFALRTAIFAGIGAAIFFTARRRDAYGILAFASVTILVAFLWSSAWSTQWQANLVPLILLLMPNRQGVLITLALAFTSFLEYPLLFARNAEPNMALGAESVLLYTLLIFARTLILFGLAAYCVARLRQAPQGN